MEFSEDIKELIKTELDNKDIYSMSLEELKKFREDVVDKRHEYSLIELAQKTRGNAAYGSSACPAFYFYNTALAADITGECRQLTKMFWNRWPEFFHETLWERKDLWEKFDFELDESKHNWYREQTISIYSDTDSTSKNSFLLIKDNNDNKKTLSIEELYNKAYKENGQFIITENGQEIVESNDNVLNWTEDKKLHYSPIKYIMRHKVSKPKFKIKTKSGKEIIVTGDHSCIVFRDGKKISIKAKDINPATDKILSIVNNEN